MAYYYSRVYQDLQRSRRYALDAQSQLRRSRRIQQTLDMQETLRKLATAQKIRADRQYEQYILRRETQKQQIQADMLRQRLIRQQQLNQQQAFMQAQRRSRIIREDQIERQRHIQFAQQRKRAQFLAHSRRLQQQAKAKLQQQITRQNILIQQQQIQQKKLQEQLRAIDVEIGTIYDQRQDRRKTQLLELQVLDQKIFKIKQQIRGSKIKQKALEQSLDALSKIIVPGAK